MCGSSQQLPKGGAMAVIHATTPTTAHAEPPLLARLWFSNTDRQTPAASYTSLICETWDEASRQWMAGCDLRIHEHGQLGLSEQVPNDDEGRLMHEVKGQMVLRERLNLHTGPGGIIGRLVTVTAGGERVGEGIVGWI